MKIRCDVCDKDEASVFCVADEAALCSACDHRVHHANKLAGKHHRFSLLLPSPKQIPICDICQERRAFLFCQQDRAILCRECDIPIHKANEHTQKHNRFLLTGVRVSANSSLYSSNPTTEGTESSDIVHHQISKSKAISAQQSPILKNPIGKDSSSILNSQMVMNGGKANVPTKSLSEYSIDMLQGWHVDDFLDSSSPYGFCENGSNGSGDMMPFWDADFGRNLSSYSPESSGAWVPQAATPLYSDDQIQSFPTFNMPTFGDQISFKETKDISTFKPSKKWSDDNSFAVPQINPHSTISNKRSRNLR